MSLRSEIFEQPAVLARLLDTQRATVEQIAGEIRARDVNFVMLAGRGTSQHAGLYAKYLWGTRNGLSLSVASPSLFTIYEQPPRLKNALVVGVSQSGQSPDVVNVLAAGNEQGCMTLAVTNTPDSPLAETADFVLDIGAGLERAVAATKTYSAQLMTVAMLSAALADEPAMWDDLARVSTWAEQALALDEHTARVAERYRFMHKCVVLGRGYNYATALEWGLKLKELTYVFADPYSTAGFQHGPIAMVEAGFPVLAVAPAGKVLNSILPVLRTVRQDLNAELLVISDVPDVAALGQSAFRLPAGIPEWLTPLIAILPAQLFALHLTAVKHLNPEQPRNIKKVTETL